MKRPLHVTRPLLNARSAIQRERLLDLSTDIAVCVHDGLDYVQPCLESIMAHFNPGDRLIVVDDGSREPTRSYVRNFLKELGGEHVYVRHEQAGGYTAAANAALRRSRADYVILLNSDAVVTQDWSVKLKEVGESAPDIGVVGPMSNAASWQSIPRLLDEHGDHAVNDVPPGWTIADLDQFLEISTVPSFPRVPLVNGFCFALKRAVIDKVGLLDEKTFPHYGEENDYCFRMTDAGLMGAIAIHTYVYHAKSKSYSHERRRPLIERNSRKWHELYGKYRVTNAFETMRRQPMLARVRRDTHRLWPATRATPGNDRAQLSVLFLASPEKGAGSLHLIAQDARGLSRLGVSARVAVPARLLPSCGEELGGDPRRSLLLGYSDEVDLIAQASSFDVVVGTLESSVETMAAVCSINEDVLPAYHVQEYDVSGTRIPNAVLFAKSWRICRTVEHLHGVRVFKLPPSVDTDVFYAPTGPRRAGPVRIAAMVRAPAPRAAPRLPPRGLLGLHEEFGDAVEIHTFGASDRDLHEAGLPRELPLSNHGALGRQDVADLLRETDIFVDCSAHRGPAHAGLEAMACGNAVVLPAVAGVDDYARSGWNAILSETVREQSLLDALRTVVGDGELRTRLRRRGLATARRFAPSEVARSIRVLLTAALRAHRASRVERRCRGQTIDR